MGILCTKEIHKYIQSHGESLDDIIAKDPENEADWKGQSIPFRGTMWTETTVYIVYSMNGRTTITICAPRNPPSKAIGS